MVPVPPLRALREHFIDEALDRLSASRRRPGSDGPGTARQSADSVRSPRSASSAVLRSSAPPKTSVACCSVAAFRSVMVGCAIPHWILRPVRIFRAVRPQPSNASAVNHTLDTAQRQKEIIRKSFRIGTLERFRDTTYGRSPLQHRSSFGTRSGCRCLRPGRWRPRVRLRCGRRGA